MPGKHTLAAHKKQSIAEKPDEHKSHARHPVSCATASARRGRHPMLFDQRFDRCDQRAQRLASMGDRVLLGRLHFGGRELFAGVDRTLRLIVRHKQRIVAETVGTHRDCKCSITVFSSAGASVDTEFGHSTFGCYHCYSMEEYRVRNDFLPFRIGKGSGRTV